MQSSQLDAALKSGGECLDDSGMQDRLCVVDGEGDNGCRKCEECQHTNRKPLDTRSLVPPSILPSHVPHQRSSLGLVVIRGLQRTDSTHETATHATHTPKYTVKDVL